MAWYKQLNGTVINPHFGLRDTSRGRLLLLVGPWFLGLFMGGLLPVEVLKPLWLLGIPFKARRNENSGVYAR